MRTETRTVAVIGGGIAGLATAFNLERLAEKKGLRLGLRLFEANPAVGGNLGTIQEHGYCLEEGPNGFLDNEPATLRLVRRLGLEDRLQRSEDATKHRFLLNRGRLSELPVSPPAFLRTDLLSLGAKLRVALEPFIAGRKDWADGRDETVYDFGCRRLGKAFAEAFLDPMVKGVFGGDARCLSLAAAFPRMVELEREYGSLFKALFKISRQRKKAGGAKASPGPGGVLHSFYRGIAELPARLGERLQASIRTGQPVEKVRRRDGAWWLEIWGREHGPFAAVINTAPAHRAAGQFEDQSIRRLLAEIPYVPMVVTSLAYDRSRVAHDLNGFGMLIPSREKRRLLGVLWSTSIFTARAPTGKIVLRCMAGGPGNEAILDRDDEALVRLCEEELGELFGLQGKPERSWIIRYKKAIAQFEPGHLARLAELDKARVRWPGLYLAGSGYRGISINHCVAEAEKTAASVLAGFTQPSEITAR